MLCMEIIFLGTSAMVPTKERNHTSILLKYKSDHILVDCGEGTQRQLKLANVPLPSITKLLITHWDGDHVLGIPGLLQSLSTSNFDKTLQVYGPARTKVFLKKIMEISNHHCAFDIVVKEISSGKFFETDDYYLEACRLEHTTPTLGYNFVEKDKRRVDIAKMKKLGIPEGPMIGKLVDGKSVQLDGKKISPDDITYVQKGKKVTFILDSAFTKSVFKLAKNADLLICESTYGPDLEEKAIEYKHMTSAQAAQIASLSDAQKLILTHFSARYKDTKDLETEARKIFKDTTAAYDLMKVNL